MGFSPLANMSRRIPDGGRSAPRAAAVTGMGLHHNAGVDAFGQATAPGREVSANYWITNDGTILPNIDETRRAFTSGAVGYPAGAAADHRNITVEISNSPEGVRSGSWAISEAAMSALVALIADVWKRYGLGRVARGADRGLGVHRDWVPTVCPGPYIMGNLGAIIERANTINDGAAAPEDKGDENMPRILHMRETLDGKTNTDKAFLDGGPGVGVKHIANPYHYGLLTRFLADKPGDRMYPAELAIINTYLAPNVPILSAETVEAAVTKAIKAAGGSVEAGAVAAAVESVLKDDFAAIPAATAVKLGEKLS